MRTLILSLIAMMSVNAAAANVSGGIEFREYRAVEGNDPYCDTSVTPEFQDVDGRKVLVLSPRIHMTWENRSSAKGSEADCNEQYNQKVEEKGDSSFAVFETHLQCAPGNYSGSLRKTIKIKDKQIEFRYETMTFSSGKWVVDPKQPGYSCRWR